MRAKLRINPLKHKDSRFSNEISQASSHHHELLSRANRLADKYNSVCNMLKEFSSALERAKRWLSTTEPRVAKLSSEPIGSEPRVVEDKLQAARALQHEIIANRKLIEDVHHASTGLLRLLEDSSVSPQEKRQIEQSSVEVQTRYDSLVSTLAAFSASLDNALVQMQGIQDALSNLLGWLDQAEGQMKTIMKPASLIRERLDEQIHQIKLLQSDVERHNSSMKKVIEASQVLIQSGKNNQESRKIDTQVKESQARFQAIAKALDVKDKQLDEVSKHLDMFSLGAHAFDEWYFGVLEHLDSLDGSGDAKKIDEVVKIKEKKRPEFENLISGGKALVTKKDVTDTNLCKDTILELEQKWKELSDLLGEKMSQNSSQKQALAALESLQNEVSSWLQKMEAKVDRLAPVALDIDALKQQGDELKPLIQEHKGFSKTLEKFNEVVMQYDALVSGGLESSRRKSVSPRKPSMLTGGNVGRSPSGLTGRFPRRESSKPSYQDQNPAISQLGDFNARYDLLGVKLADRDRDVTNVKEEVKVHFDNLKQISGFLEKQEKNLPNDQMMSDGKSSDKNIKIIRAILDALMENQPLLDETRVGIRETIKKHPKGYGADQLNAKLNDSISKWKLLQDKCKIKLGQLDGLKEFNDTHDSLNNWLTSKGRMMTVLGPISSDPRLIQNQIGQITLILEEFGEKVPQKTVLNELGNELLTQGNKGANIREKLDHVNKKWDDILGQLNDRKRELEELFGPTKDFISLTTRIQDNLGKISDDLDDAITSKANSHAKIKNLEAIAQKLDSQRPLWAETEAVANHLCDILTDPTSITEINSKMGQVERQFNTCQKKLDNALAELENAAREGKEFEEACQHVQEMLKEFESLLSEKLSVSADKSVLKQQMQQYEPLYQEIMSKEHEIIMLINKSKTIAAGLPSSEGQKYSKFMESTEKQWQKVKKAAQERHKRLTIAMELCRKFDLVIDKFLPWLDKAEHQLSKMNLISLVKSELQKQEKELQQFRNDVNRHSSEFDLTLTSGMSFIDACDIDKDFVKEELGDIKERWSHLNASINERGAAIADLLGKLSDFNDDVRDIAGKVNRMEEKLSGLEKGPQDAKTLEGLLEDTKEAERLFEKARGKGEHLIDEASQLGADTRSISDTLNGLKDRLGKLRGNLENKISDLKTAGSALTNFNALLKGLNNSVSLLDDELNKMGPIARDLQTLDKQEREITSFIGKIQSKQKEVSGAMREAEQLHSKGFVPNPKDLNDSITSMAKQLEKLQSRANSREKDVHATIEKLGAFYDHFKSVMSSIQDLIEKERSFGSVGAEIDGIKKLLEEFKVFQKKYVDSAAKEVEKCNRNGQNLIQSAASGVNTSQLENDLQKMNELWNTLKKNISERERKLDQGLLQSGKFQEALAGLLAWFGEMDDMISNQKPPSSDYKVVRAQVQEQKFVAKLLGDRKSGIDSIIRMGHEICASADPAKKQMIQKDIAHMEQKYMDLNKKCKDRTDLLEEAMQMAKEYQGKLGPLEKWLDQMEKKVSRMEIVPTDEDQIQKRIHEHDKIHKEALAKQTSFDDLADIASALMQVVGDDDAQGLAEKIEELTNRFAGLVTSLDNVGQLLQDSLAGLRNLVLAYEALLDWMEKTEKLLSKYKVLSVFSEKLLSQMEDLHRVTEDVVAHQKSVEEVIAIGNELMRCISNEEALQLKDKLDVLQRKYSMLATRAADLLKNAQDMTPLVQKFHQSHNKLSEWLTGCEGILQSLDTYNMEDQELEIKRLEQDIVEIKPLVENINIFGPQLCQMSPGDGARTIEDIVTRDNKRFEAICEQIQRRSERIQLSKQRSSEIVHEIDELLDWFREVENQIREAEKPSCEPDVIRVQLKEHKALNDDISSQKGRVRDVLTSAKKVLRESAQTVETEQVKEKMEDLKETMETVIKLSIDRLNTLEQALPLSEHFFDTHHELLDWLTLMERETMNQLMPAMRPDLIAKQQEINRSLMQSVKDHKPVIDKLAKTGGALLRLIVEDDAYRIQEIIESDTQRYNALKLGLHDRQQALEDAMQECSQFTDKLDGILNALGSIGDQVNNFDPISAHPDKLKEQIDENRAIVEDLSKKEPAVDVVRKAAAEIINKSGNKNDPTIRDIIKKLDKINQLWDHNKKATKDRESALKEALALAEKFWSDYSSVMSRLKDIHDGLQNQDPPGVDPTSVEAQLADLKALKKKFEALKPDLEKCKKEGLSLIALVGDPEKPELKRNLEDLNSSWDLIASLFAKREKSLQDALDKAKEFQSNLQALSDFLAKSERKFDNLGPIGTDIEAVKKQIEQLKGFKNEVDPWMVKVEALNR